MRRVEPPPEPAAWRVRVLEPGQRWLASGDRSKARRPHPCWLACRDAIGESFDFLCCYTAMYVPNGQADHFAPWQRVRGTAEQELAYTWNNFRYADGWINASKGLDRFPDPFIVQDTWFELELPSLVLRATSAIPADQLEAAKRLLRRVGDDERVMKQRRRYLKQYLAEDRSFALLEQDAPLLARALRQHPEHLLPADRARLVAGLL